MSGQDSSECQSSNFNGLLVDAYLLNSLNRCPKDRDFIVRTENTLLQTLFASSSNELQVVFPSMNSYYRMIVHRMARYYDLQHVADANSRTVVVSRETDCKAQLPLLKLCELVEPEAVKPPEQSKTTMTAPPKFTILRRDCSSTSKVPNMVGNLKTGATNTSTRSIVEREEAYEKARARIFGDFQESSLDPTISVSGISSCPPPLPQQQQQQSQSQHQEEEGEKTGLIMSTERITFKGWKNIDQIRPFIPAGISPSSSSEGTGEDPLYPSINNGGGKMAWETASNARVLQDRLIINLDDIYIPRHIYVVNLPRTSSEIGLLKDALSKCHGKLKHRHSSTTALVYFSYQADSYLEEIATKSQIRLTPWRPNFLPEPPL